MTTIAVTERAPPKVNLTLRVRGRRADGYHDLESLVAFAGGIADVVTLHLRSNRSVSAHGPFAPSIAGENLLAVALDRLAQAEPDIELGAVSLEKNLPVAAGIGGGSADAAALIRAVVRANPAKRTTIDWLALARSLGADVPVCLASTAQLMEGIGDRLTPLPGLPPLDAVLVNPCEPVPPDKTARVFRTLAAPPLADPSPPRLTPLEFGGRAALLAHMRSVGNDLTTPARSVVPTIDAVLAALEIAPACELAQVSGGGPTCFGIYPDAEAAAEAARIIGGAHPNWWVVHCRLS